jgi:hypothetical protein
MRRNRLHVCTLLVPALLLTACSSRPAPAPYAREYPKDLPQEAVLDIQVFRGTKTVEFTNTTGRAFGPCTLWLNARFSRPIDSIAVGQTITLPLADFRDQWQDAFRGGGFFATELPDRLVLAQLEVPRPDALQEGQKPSLLGMVVVRSEDE